MNDVAGRSERVREREEAPSLALRVMEEHDLGHDAVPITLGDLETSRPFTIDVFAHGSKDCLAKHEYGFPVVPEGNGPDSSPDVRRDRGGARRRVR